ncbi:Tex family protein [candidate division KSB1 bacterium]
MNEKHISKIAEELNIKSKQVEAVVLLLNDDATVPFIARYRKEATGSLDEVAVTGIRDRLAQLGELDKRREAILKSLDERDLLTDELKEKIMNTETMAVLEDIYLPFRPKRRTRALIAREKGLEPLAELLVEQTDIVPETEAEQYIDPEKKVETVEDALAGARDIIAEWVNENEEAREKMRKLYREKSIFKAKVITGKENEAVKYKDYYEWEAQAMSVKSHSVLAMRRGERELFLSLRILPPEEEALELLENIFIKANNLSSEQVKIAVHDSYKRLLSLSMETEMRVETKDLADDEAIAVFAENLRNLLLAPPLGQKNVLGIDPAYRTGCKIVCLDKQGKLLCDDKIFLLKSEREEQEAAQKITAYCEKYDIEIIAIGNGTASRETESFVRGLELSGGIPVVMVNESGASVYSASEAAREEFPSCDITVRGAISIGRRLMDPLAELVKIDPKSIGVGQYQHDVDQTLLKNSLDDVVISCVNSVGVEVNTASKQLLTYVSGLGPKLAQSIIDYRNENGAFGSRESIKKVKGVGKKAFEQAAGFLRIRDGENPLDASAVHPESYPVVNQMAGDLGCSVTDLMKNRSLREKIELKKYINDKIGLPTLNDIIQEFEKPGRDPREKFEIFSFTEGVEKIEDLKVGMKLPGIVTNVTNFGAFVDVGVHQDGLVHISQLAERFVKNPADIVQVNQKVNVTVVDIDIKRKRIALSMKKSPDLAKTNESAS